MPVSTTTEAGTGFEVALRLDTEDFLTPESDDALVRILDALDARGLTATFPLVGEKLRSWRRRGRSDLVGRLGRHAVGYHSDTHSMHPTIAEELAPLPWQEACAAFAARERAGFDLVAATFGPPVCWTQPGGNWTASALPVLASWGVPMEFSEAWNSYLDVGAVPCRYGGVLHWSPPVSAPKPFLSGLPRNLTEAIDVVRRGRDTGAAAPVCVVAHPTELCTEAFWDTVNFAGGKSASPQDWRPAPVRPTADVDAAAAALAGYLDALQRMGASFVTAADLARRHPDLAAGALVPAAAIRDLASLAGSGPNAAVCAGLAISPAEIFALVGAALADDPELRRSATIRPCNGPAAAAPLLPAPAAADRAALVTAARHCRAFIAEHGRIPEAVPLGTVAVPPASFLMAAARLLADPAADGATLTPVALACTRIVKPKERLHWDWPIFPPGFAPLGLLEAARLQAWTWKPAPPRPVRPDWLADRWRPASPESQPVI